MVKFLPAYAAIACFVLLLCRAAPIFAAEPVKIEVIGIKDDALKNVQEALALPSGFVRDGRVDRLWLERFAKQIEEKARHALEPYGYYQAQVSVRVEESQKGAYKLLVTVTPGKPVVLGEVVVELQGPGAAEEKLRRLVKRFPLVKGGRLVQPDYEQAKNELKTRAIALGYLDAVFSRHAIHIAPGAVTATIDLALQTGERYFFDDVRIEGAPDYPQSYLRRFVVFKKGEVFSYAKLAETQLNFSNSERFKEVVVSPEIKQARELHIPVLVKLASAPRRSLRPGVGYGTDTGARFTVRYRDLNLFRKGQDLNLNLYVAEHLQGFAALYTRPDKLDLKSSSYLQLNLQQENVTTYLSRLAALELGRNRSFSLGELGTVYIKLLEENYTVGSEKSSARLVLPGVRFQKEQFDNLVRPRQGYRYALDLRGAHPYLGSDSALVQGIADGTALVALPKRFTLYLRSKIGASLLADPLSDLPPSIRFFAGGDQSVRGYAYQSLGPRNASGQVVGGKNLLVGSIELERALFKNWGVSIFHDAGNAFNSFNNMQLSQGAGIGVHYYTPVGGLNFSLAKRLGTSKELYYLHFTVGFQF